VSGAVEHPEGWTPNTRKTSKGELLAWRKTGLTIFWEYGKMADMKTTLDIPDDLFREIKAKAALEGLKLKDLVAEALRAVLSGKQSATRKPRRIKFPVLASRGKARLAIPDDAVYRADLMDDLARHEAALR
jgi:hypothetical protein